MENVVLKEERKRKMDNNKELLNKVLSMDYTELVPSRTFKGELYILNDEEFDMLRKHIKINDLDLLENNYDTIIISNIIFKKET